MGTFGILGYAAKERERERERETHTHTHTHRKRDRDRQTETDREGTNFCIRGIPSREMHERQTNRERTLTQVLPCASSANKTEQQHYSMKATLNALSTMLADRSR